MKMYNYCLILALKEYSYQSANTYSDVSPMSRHETGFLYRGGKMKKKTGIKPVVENRRARHEYHIEETYEAGLALVGTEVKSLRNGKGNLQDAYAIVKSGEVWVNNFHISPYEQGNQFNHDPKRPKKLLLHKNEIRKLLGLQKEKGYALIPLKIFFKHGLAKMDLAVAVGKKLYDKRQDMADRDARRDLERAIKSKGRDD